jgi:hypothetical protein
MGRCGPSTRRPPGRGKILSTTQETLFDSIDPLRKGAESGRQSCRGSAEHHFLSGRAAYGFHRNGVTASGVDTASRRELERLKDRMRLAPTVGNDQYHVSIHYQPNFHLTLELDHTGLDVLTFNDLARFTTLSSFRTALRCFISDTARKAFVPR